MKFDFSAAAAYFIITVTAYPILTQPLLKERVWGGNALAALGKRLPQGVRVGESWELADLPASIPGGRSIIANGPLAGQTLHQALARHRQAIMGSARLSDEGGFPLLIKYLDARENLSVQVHPSPEYAASHSEARVKCEAWVVIDAAPGAVIYKGIKPHVSAGQFRHDIVQGRAVEDLIAVPVAAGDCHYLPSGVCHALGAGVLVAEVQTPSDTTFRVYDWGRPPAAGRALHLDQAFQCIRFGQELSTLESQRDPEPRIVGGLRTTRLVRTPHFLIDRIEAEKTASLPITTSNRPRIWMMLAGRGRIQTPGIPNRSGGLVDLEPGTTALLPAALDGAVAELSPGAGLLSVALPGPMDGFVDRAAVLA